MGNFVKIIFQPWENCYKYLPFKPFKTLEFRKKSVIIIVAVKVTAFLFIIKNGKGRRGPFHSCLFMLIINLLFLNPAAMFIYIINNLC